ncbi:hypothetical protein DICPUDRAFT_54379 [Dictyostelium purpureum]|uniref:Peptidase M3A/M3B catalytic domain-containing protein n=1 Tax=Dictyostelium purpureum TaxID=5786 RepID=F0ZGU0_DICPU|nr:uncharacterized protein DICPUDRAFT_54379 [Dictyostelium purpureum]EGC36834.1 hypothetical protein DICPUDRAFT_54379 [Dictyostelium purpureum]|eukprot:XP_003286632.1 hypothetical protein DICPUDRAFT_54379 [Dictyostelium purpureum]
MDTTNKLFFPKSKEEFTKLSDELIKTYDQGLQTIIDIPKEKKTFENTFDATERLNVAYSIKYSALTFPSSVNVDKEIRDISNEVESVLSKHSIENSMREDLYQAYVQCCQQNNDFKDSSLTEEQKRYVKKTLEGFEKNGLQLPKEKRDELKAIKTEISDLCIQFSKNLSEDKTKLSFSPDQLKGVPKDIVESLEKDESKEGNYFVSLKYPEIQPVIKYCSVPETRKAAEFANASKCMKENTPILEKTMQLRYKAAQILGYKDWASFKSHYLMVQTNENIQAFTKRMVDLLQPHGRIEFEKLKELKKQDYLEKGLEHDGNFYSYDYVYYSNLMLVKDYQVDNNLVKEYFPMDVVFKGIFDIYQDLLSVKFTEEKPIESWHEDVKMYSVSDSTDGRFMGYFYLDLFPRDGKYTHAAVWPLIEGFRRGNEGQVPVASMVCNFTKPTATAPSLLTHDEVVTAFHEFGHVMHNMSTKVSYSMFSGTSVERDFVECPSQLFENWCWDKDILVNKLSGHYKDNSKKLPGDLVDRMVASKNLNIALFYLRQLQYSTFDNTIHGSNPENFVNTADLFRQIQTNIFLNPNQKGTHPGASFEHVMGGYDAQYYSYMFSEVFSASIFEKFQEKGVMNKELGKKLRDLVLAVGGSQDSNVTIRSFLGEAPKESAFLKTINLA